MCSECLIGRPPCAVMGVRLIDRLGWSLQLCGVAAQWQCRLHLHLHLRLPVACIACHLITCVRF